MSEERPLLGPYRIERRLAAGGMAEVFVARREGLHGFSKRVALKRILPQFASDPDFVGMFISGGRAPEYIRYDKTLLRVTKEIAESGKPIACLCHGIEILSAADCIRGKRVTTVPKCALDAEQGGAVYVDEPVVVDGLLVTGRGYGENTEVLREFIRMLKDV